MPRGLHQQSLRLIQQGWCEWHTGGVIFTKAEFDKILAEKLSLADIRKKYGTHPRIWLRSLGVHGREEWNKAEPARRAMKMGGNKNGNRPPSKLVPKEVFLELFSRKLSKCEMMRHLRLSEFSMDRNIEIATAHGFRLFRLKWRDQKSFETLQASFSTMLMELGLS